MLSRMAKSWFSAAEIHPGHPGVVRPVRVDRSGSTGPTRGQARGPHFRRTSQGFYVPSSVDGSVPEQRIVEASAILPRYGGVTGWASLRWAGGVWFDGTTAGGHELRAVTLATGYDDVLNQPGVQISQERLNPRDLLVVDGLAVTSHVRSVCFEMRYASSVRAAVQALDLAAYSDLVSIDEVATYAARHSGWIGIPQCRKALTLADENSWSPRETWMRLTWILDAGLPPALTNRPVFDDQGRHVGTPDLLDPEAGVVGEYDGHLHLQGAQRRRDREREEQFRSLGLEYSDYPPTASQAPRRGCRIR